MSPFIKTLTVVAALSLSNTLWADAGHENIGKPGKADDAKRIVEVILGEMFFNPAEVKVEAGETVHFVLVNQGQLLHEFSIGTPDMHAHHRDVMATMMEHGMLTPTGVNEQMMHMDHSQMGMPAMQHDDPNSVLVEPGQTQELIWAFPRSGTLALACTVPGHSEAGMVGQVVIGQ